MLPLFVKRKPKPDSRTVFEQATALCERAEDLAVRIKMRRHFKITKRELNKG